MAEGTTYEARLEADEPRPGPSLRSLVHIVFRWKLAVLAVFVLTVAAAKVVEKFFTTPLFLATSQVMVSPGRENVEDLTLPTRGAVPPWVRFNIEEEIARAREILTGRFLAERVVDAVGPDALYGQQWERDGLVAALLGHGRLDRQARREAAIDAFMQDVSVDAAGRSSIINVSFRHPDPEIAARAVNFLTEMYLERYLGMQKNPKADAFFEEQFGLLKKKLKDSEAQMLAFKQRHGITTSVADEQASVRQQQIRLRAELNEARARQAELQSRDAEIRKLLAAHGSLYGNLQADLIRNSAEEKAVLARQAALAAKVADFQSRLDALERVSDEFNHLEKQVRADEENYRLYMTKFEESRISGAMDAQRIVSVRVLEPAHPPRMPLPSKAGRLMLMAILGGAVGGVGLAYVLQLLSGSLNTAEDVERALDVPVLTSIPVGTAGRAG
jgi:polysaccharide biosynthesis protein PslE